MLKIWQAIILGLVQGVAEFLPISSSGHLILIEKVMQVETGDLFVFNIVLHIGTLVAVIVHFWDDIMVYFRNPLGYRTKYLLIASLPAIILGFLLSGWIESMFSGGALGFCFLVNGILLYLAEYFTTDRYTRKLDKMNWVDAVFIGLAQAFAMIPGISRNGMCIASGMSLGFNRKDAGRFSMLMSIIVIAGSVVLEVPKAIFIGTLGVSWGALIAGVLASALAGYFAISLLLVVIHKGNLRIFAYYLAAISLIVLGSRFLWHGIFA